MSYKQHLKNLEHCPFCKKDHSQIIYKSTFHYVKIALAPYGENHFLIIPHKHITSMIDYTEEMLKELTSIQQTFIKFLYDMWYQEVALMIRDWNDKKNIKTINSTTWKSINHFHYHIIPDCNLRAVSLMSLSKPNKRKIINNKEIKIINNKRKKWYHSEVKVIRESKNGTISRNISRIKNNLFLLKRDKKN